MSRKPIAVLISDIHFTPSTLELASKSLVAAKNMANELRVPLVIAGDTLDSKAIIRGECANRLIEILNQPYSTRTIILVGNHDLINEKGKEHSLNFLRPYCQVIDKPYYDSGIGCYLIPYMNNTEELQKTLNSLKKGSLIIMHQGVQTAYMGHYVQDKTSLPKEAFSDFRVISGHYHRSQDIKCGRPKKGAVGLFSYIGNPYTLSFAEAEDGPKGFQVLHDNGLMEKVVLDLRRHLVYSRTLQELKNMMDRGPEGAFFGRNKPDDLIWLKVSGPKSELAKLRKKNIGLNLYGHQNFKLDKIYTLDETEEKVESSKTVNEKFDTLIDNLGESEKQKSFLKSLWRSLMEG